MDRAKEERENESYRSRESYRSSFFVVNYPRYGVFTEEWKKNYIFNLYTIAWILWKIGTMINRLDCFFFIDFSKMESFNKCFKNERNFSLRKIRK